MVVIVVAFVVCCLWFVVGWLWFCCLMSVVCYLVVARGCLLFAVCW